MSCSQSCISALDADAVAGAFKAASGVLSAACASDAALTLLEELQLESQSARKWPALLAGDALLVSKLAWAAVYEAAPAAETAAAELAAPFASAAQTILANICCSSADEGPIVACSAVSSPLRKASMQLLMGRSCPPLTTTCSHSSRCTIQLCEV